MQLMEGWKNFATSRLYVGNFFSAICWAAEEYVFIPRNLHLSKANIGRLIVVASPSKFDILWFISCPESGLCSLVEASSYVVNVIHKF